MGNMRREEGLPVECTDANGGVVEFTSLDERISQERRFPKRLECDRRAGGWEPPLRANVSRR